MSISDEALARLRELDTPTVSNAVESFGVRPGSLGHADAGVRCMFPELGAALGFAVTFTTSEYAPGETRSNEERAALYRAVADAPRPCVLVHQDLGPRPRSACFWGEIMSNLFSRLGAEGVATDGAARDLDAMREAGFKTWCAGTTASRGDVRVSSVNAPVSVGGMAVLPGDLIHADASGVVVVPKEIAPEVPDAARRVLDKEAKMLEAIRAENFDLDDLIRQFWG